MLKMTEENRTQEPVPDEIPKGYYRIELDSLPSKGIAYPKGTKILSRPLKVIELKHLATMTEKTADAVINDVLKGSVLGIDYGDLVVADKVFLIMWQRAQTYKDDRFGVTYVCPECGSKDKYVFDVSEIEMDDVDPDYSPEKEYDLGSAKVRIDQPRVKDVARVTAYMKDHPDADPEILGSIAYRILSVGGKEVSIDEAYDFCVNLPGADFVKLNGICRKTEMSINPIVRIACGKCGRKVPVGVSFRSDFFLPEYTGW